MADEKEPKPPGDEKERMTIYLPQDVARAVRDIAEANKRTISAQVEVMLTDDLQEAKPAPSRR